VGESKSNVNVQPETGALPCIAHVEVGGSLGGSVLRLGAYLKHCDPKMFRHEVVFYRRPAGSESVFDGRWAVIDLGYAVPPQSGSEDEKARRWARTFLVNRPRLHAWVGLVRGGWNLLASIPRALRLARCFRRRGYDLIHCNNSFTYQIPTVLAAWFARKPLVSHFRTIRRLNWWETRLARIAICIVAINEAVAENLKRQGVSTPLLVCHNPFGPPTASPENVLRLRRELLGDGATLVGTVSRLEEGKGVEDFLAAARNLQRRWPEVRYVIVGDGSKAEAFKRLATDWGLNDRVHFAGFKSSVYDCYAGMDIFVCSSLAEGGPATVVEAMQLALPVVSTRVGRVPQLIRDRENGIIVEPSDVDGLTRALELLLAEPSLRREMGARAGASLQTLSDAPSHAQELDKVFARVLSGGRPGICGRENGLGRA
jgi:glycosyltransferase involved in cell wall biosynthesis